MLPFAQQAALGGEQQVIGQLLGDGGAAHELDRPRGHCARVKGFAALLGLGLCAGKSLLLLLLCAFHGPGVACTGLFNRIPLHAVVVRKIIVFSGNHGTFQMVGDAAVGHPLLAPSQMAFVAHLAPGLAALECGGGGVDRCHQRYATDKEQLQAQCQQQCPT
ncbi:hypothetical protein D3C72_1135260 [compost metagenome]